MIHSQIDRGQTDRRPLILIVDDVPENGSIVQRRLERMNLDCIVADGGQLAIDMIRRSNPSLVLLDFMMPDVCGLTVLRHLRADPQTAGLPVIMLTARTDSEAVVESLKAGANDYVHKPIDFAVLRARIEAQLEHEQQTRALMDANDQLDGRAASRAVELGEVRGLLHKEMDRADRLQSQLAQGGPILDQLAGGFRRIVELCGQGRHAESSILLACLAEAERIATAGLRKIDCTLQGVDRSNK